MCGSRYEIGGSGPVDLQTVDPRTLDPQTLHLQISAVPDPTSPDKCGSRSEIGGSSPVDPQTLDFQNPLFRVLCRQGVIMFPVSDFSRSVLVLRLRN